MKKRGEAEGRPAKRRPRRAARAGESGTVPGLSTGRGQSTAPQAESLSLALEALKPHDHLCLIYESREEWRAAAVPFIAVGLQHGEKCIYITDTSSAAEIRRHLDEEGIDTQAAEQSGRLSILHEREAYSSGGSFDPDRMIATLASETEKAVAEGYPALRVTGEMTWILRGISGSERLLEYEAKLSDFFPRYPCLAICQYDRWRSDPELIKGVIMTHPLLVRGNRIYRNFYHVPPEEFLNAKRADMEAQHWLNNLERERQTLAALRQSEENFRTLAENADDGLLVAVGENADFAYANRRAAEISGYSVEELLRMSLRDLVDPEASESLLGMYRTRLAGRPVPGLREGTLIRRDGQKALVEFGGSTTWWQDRPADLAVFRDITERKTAEQAVRESEERFRALTENLSDTVLVIDERGVFKYVSPSVRQTLGYRPEDLLGTAAVEVVHPDDRESVAEAFEQARRSPRTPVTIARRWHLSDGTWRAVEAVGTNHLDNPAINGFVGTLRDISERHRAEQAVRESEERFRSIVETAPSMLLITDAAGKNIYVSPNCERTTGYTSEELMAGSGWWLSEEAMPAARARLEEALRSGAGGRDVEYRAFKKSGEPWYASSSWEPLKNDTGELRGLVLQTVDITERKKAEKALREREERFRALTENLSDILQVIDEHGVISYLSPSVRQMLGYRPEELLGTPALGGVHPDDRERIAEALEEARRKPGTPVTAVCRCRHRDGTWHHIEGVGVNHLGNPAINGFVSVLRDVTERTKAEEALSREREKLRALVDGLAHTGIGIDIVGTDYKVRFQNAVLQERFGQLEGRSCYEGYMELDKPCDPCPMRRAIENDAVQSVQLTGRDGRQYELLAAPLPEPDGTVSQVVGVVIDITERKKAEDELRAARDFASSIVASMPDGFSILDLDGVHIDVNASLCRMTGFSRDELIGVGPPHPYWAPEALEDFETAFEKTRDGEFAERELTFMRKNGERFPAIVNPACLKDQEGKPAFFFAIIKDITERKRMEEQIRASLAEKELLLKEVHHRVRNNMQVVTSLLNLQSGQVKDEADRVLFQASRDRIQSMALVHERLHRSDDLARVDLDAYVRDLVGELFRAYGTNPDAVRLRTDVQDISMSIDGAIPSGLIVNELVSNSLKHAFPGGRGGEILVELRTSGDDRFTLVVADNGMGLPDQIEPENASSLGLQLVHTLAGQLGGSVTLDRTNGTRFEISFPKPTGPRLK